MTKLQFQRIALVYQAGIANVFAVDQFGLDGKECNARRLLQSDFRTCESFTRGMSVAGCNVRSYACNMAGDISERQWTQDLESAPFSDEFRPVG